MPKRPQPATDAELAILKLLWDAESLTAREIREALYPDATPSAHGTVQTLLQRLEKKALIVRDSDSFAHVFRANISRPEFVGVQLDALAARLTDGSMVPFIMHAVESRGLSAEELTQIRKLIDKKRRKDQ